MNFNNLDSNNPNISHFFQYNLQEIEDLNLEIANLIKLQAKEYKKSFNHLKSCGECLSVLINMGMLIPLKDYWQITHEMGQCDHPKPRHMMN